MAKSQSIAQFKLSEQQRRIEEKSKILEQYDTSEDIFNALIDEIRTLSNDESSHDLSVGDEYNYGIDYQVDLLLEVIRDLRWFTRYDKDEDDESIESNGLRYIRDYLTILV